jgi:hypothetical protein
MKPASLAMLGASLLVASCSATTPPDVLPAFSPADPVLGLRETRHRPVVNYVHREPVGPENWRRLNDDLSPAKPGAES